jgi:hypothetical protein
MPAPADISLAPGMPRLAAWRPRELGKSNVNALRPMDADDDEKLPFRLPIPAEPTLGYRETRLHRKRRRFAKGDLTVCPATDCIVTP